MKNRLVILADRLGSSYWFVPGIMAVLAILGSVVTIELDKTVGRDLAWVIRVIYVDSPEGARAVLSTVASSMITVAGVVFSLTMVVLSLTSQQYGPLVLYPFMRDRGNQFVLGIFTSTFIYCLLILRTIRGFEDSIFVPHISVLCGLGLSIASLALLIYFIHHVAESIQSTNIISHVADNLLDGIENIFPAKLGREMDAEESEALKAIGKRFDEHGLSIPAKQSGYLQMIDVDKLFHVACKHDLIVRIDEQPGHFFIKNELMAQILPLQKADDDEVVHQVEEAFILGVYRTQNQDIEFLLVPLVSIAVRALSPGINDPYTALMCLDRLTEALCKLLKRSNPSSYRYDETAHLRVISNPLPFRALFHTALDQIRHYGHADLKVAIHLLKSIDQLYFYSESSAQRRMFREYAAAHYEECRAQFTNRIDLEQLEKAYTASLEQLGQYHDGELL